MIPILKFVGCNQTLMFKILCCMNLQSPRNMMFGYSGLAPQKKLACDEIYCYLSAFLRQSLCDFMIILCHTYFPPHRGKIRCCWFYFRSLIINLLFIMLFLSGNYHIFFNGDFLFASFHKAESQIHFDCSRFGCLIFLIPRSLPEVVDEWLATFSLWCVGMAGPPRSFSKGSRSGRIFSSHPCVLSSDNALATMSSTFLFLNNTRSSFILASKGHVCWSFFIACWSN